MYPFMDSTLFSFYTDAFRRERLQDAGYYRVGHPSTTLRLVGGIATVFEAFSRVIRRWSQGESNTVVAESRWTPLTK